MTPTGKYYYRLPGQINHSTDGKRPFSTTTVVEMEATVVEEVFEPMSDSKARKMKTKMITDRYPGMKPKEVPDRLMELSIDEIKALEQETKTRFGFGTQELQFVMRFKPTFLFW